MDKILYMNKNGDCEGHCHALDYFEDELVADGDDGDMVLIEMEVDKTAPRWCTAHGGFTEDGECGKSCTSYFPQNGKRGKCEFKTFSYSETGKEFLLSTDGLEEHLNA